MCKRLSAASVTGVDRNSHKSEVARVLGFDAAFPCIGSGVGANFDLIVDCCGSSQLVNAAVPLAAKAASILLIGNSIAGMSLSPEAMSLLLRGEIKVIASWNSNISSGLDDDWTACIRYLSNKELDPMPLITHTFPLKQIREAFEGVCNKEFDFIKVIIHPN
jgi:threonine dehydrogenase-like Zn-dependent dehydrogenase